jgi:transposase-like protein
MRPIEEFCCQNPKCSHAGKRGAGNLRLHGWSSKKSQIRTLYCRTCGNYFSERKGTALWQSRLPEEKAMAILDHVGEGCGMRQTARLVKVTPNAVCRLVGVAGRHAQRVHDEKVAFSPSDE